MGVAVLLEKREDGFQAYTCSCSVYYPTLMNNVISLGMSKGGSKFQTSNELLAAAFVR